MTLALHVTFHVALDYGSQILLILQEVNICKSVVIVHCVLCVCVCTCELPSVSGRAMRVCPLILKILRIRTS